MGDRGPAAAALAVVPSLQQEGRTSMSSSRRPRPHNGPLATRLAERDTRVGGDPLGAVLVVTNGVHLKEPEVPY